jgi:hypothetical protein
MDSSSDGGTEKVKSWIFRFIKFNIAGFIVFLGGTAIYAGLFSTFGAWSWLPASASGGVLQFCLISYLNTKKKGNMFNSYKIKGQ